MYGGSSRSSFVMGFHNRRPINAGPSSEPSGEKTTLVVSSRFDIDIDIDIAHCLSPVSGSHRNVLSSSQSNSGVKYKFPTSTASCDTKPDPDTERSKRPSGENVTTSTGFEGGPQFRTSASALGSLIQTVWSLDAEASRQSRENATAVTP